MFASALKAPATRRNLIGLIYLLPIVLALALFWHLKIAQIDGDSYSYVHWFSWRTAAYPLFLKAVPAAILLPVQLGLLVFALAILTRVMTGPRQSLLVAFAVTVGISANPYLWQLQASIMTEALTTPLLVLVLAATMHFLLGNGGRALAFAAFLSGVAVTARPSCLPVILIPLLALWLHQRPQAKVKLVWSLIGAALWITPQIADRAITARVHGDEATSLAGRHLFAKASLIDAPPLDRAGFTPLEHRVTDLMELGFEPIRDRLRRIEERSVYDIVRFNYEVCIQYNCTQEPLRDLGIRRALLEDALFKVGWQRIRQRPGAALALAWEEYRGLWMLHPRKVPESAAIYNRYLRTSPPLPFQNYLGIEGRPVSDHEQKAIYRLNRVVFWALALIVPLAGLAALFAYARGRRQPFVILTLAAVVGLQATLAFAALFGVGIARYTLGMWPTIIVALAYPIWVVTVSARGGSQAQRRRRTSNKGG